MRQVGEGELVWLLTYGLGRLPAAVRAMMADRLPDQRRRGEFFAAQALAGQLRRLEILSDAPAPPPFRNAGVEGGSGVPPIDG